MKAYKSGQRVRVRIGPAKGMCGVIVGVNQGPLTNNTVCFEVKLDDGRMIPNIGATFVDMLDKEPEPEGHATENELDKIVNRIRKLHAKAESAKSIGSLAEAETFAAAVEKMLVKHKLSMSSLQVAQMEKDEPVSEFWWVPQQAGFKRTKTRQGWSEDLAQAVAKAHFCGLFVIPGSNGLSFIGRKSDRDVCVYAYNILRRTAEELSQREYVKKFYEMKNLGMVEGARGFKASWLAGFVDGIRHKYYQEELERKRNAASTGTSLVILDQAHAAVAQYKKDKKAKTVKGGVLDRSNRDGYRAGHAAGSSASVDQGVKAGTTNARVGAGQKLLNGN